MPIHFILIDQQGSRCKRHGDNAHRNRVQGDGIGIVQRLTLTGALRLDDVAAAPLLAAPVAGRDVGAMIQGSDDDAARSQLAAPSAGRDFDDDSTPLEGANLPA